MSDLFRSENITETLEKNYMPYAMSVIVSRAIPEIDGFKPAHRKVLYTMYKMGLLNGTTKKSATIVGETMKLNPHGDASIYETLVRLSRGNGALLYPLVESKGNFGKTFSRDMAYAAARYTEAKLAAICNEVFADIDKDTVDFADNYDGTLKEPVLLPTTFPNILANPNQGIAVGMASCICSFNLGELCDTTIELIKNPDHFILSTLLAPDFPTGGQLIYSRDEMENIYKTGRGSFKVRSKYTFDKKQNCIDITEIPYTATVEAIIDKVVELVKAGKCKEITDIRDETGLKGLKITIDLKRGADPDKLMQFLYKTTPLEDAFSCNFNILIAGTPRVMGVGEILNEWTYFRRDCIKRKLYYDLQKKKDKLHLLKGLKKILLDIDKAVEIIKNTAKDDEVIFNLMIGFKIDEIQANFIAEIKLRHLNKEYILNRIEEIERLQKEIQDIEDTLNSSQKIDKIIISELENVKKKYSSERKTEILYDVPKIEINLEEEIDDYQCNFFFTKEGYFKKITPLSLRMGGAHKLKENDEIIEHIEATNTAQLLFFSDKYQVYKTKASDFSDTKASVMGEYIPTSLDFDKEENAIYMVSTYDYSGFMIFFFENGKAAKVPLKSYETKTNRKKLINAYSEKSPLVKMLHINEDCDIVLTSTNGKILIINTGLISPKATKDTQGINVMTQKGKNTLHNVEIYKESMFEKPEHYKTANIPSVGKFKRKTDDEKEQLSLI